MSDERVLQKLKTDFVPVLVHRDREPKWARIHNVRSVPVVHFTDANGEVMTTLVGSDADAVLGEMATCIEVMAMLAEDDGDADDGDGMDEDGDGGEGDDEMDD